MRARSHPQALAQAHKANLFETSAKQGEGVAAIFDCIVTQHHARTALGGGGSSRSGLPLGEQKESKRCC